VTLTRTEVASLEVQSDVYRTVVEAWSLLLNELELRKKSDMSRIYMGIHHIVSFLLTHPTLLL
jgi:hypothetical protein